MGLVAFGHMWLQMMLAAQARLDNGTDDKEFFETKIATGRYFFSHMLIETPVHRARVEAGAENMMALAANAF